MVLLPVGGRALRSKSMNVLFVCEDNCSLGLMAESILATLGDGRFRAYSAGCTPGYAVDHDVIEFLAQHHMRTPELHPKSLAAFRTPHAPRLDFIITLCDAAAAENFADWPGAPFVAHWNVQDEAGDDSAAGAHRHAFWTLWRRIKIFVALPHGTLNRRALERRALTLQASYL
jgi:protein-tyrosine-phosphatase